MVKKKMLAVTVCLFVAFLWLSIPAWAGEPEMVIDFDVPSNAQVTQISISPGKMAGKPIIFVKAKVKNIGSKPATFKTKCDFVGTPNSQGFMVPKTGTPALKPGQAKTAKYPYPSTELPKKMKIKIVEYSLDD
jgi:hypothetical protein